MGQLLAVVSDGPATLPDDMVWIPGGGFRMGSDHHYPEEAPAHRVTVGSFLIDRYSVTNDQFMCFVKATGYVTVAERRPDPKDYPGAKPEMLRAASVVFARPKGPVDIRNHHNWWTYVPGANWRRPEGPGSSLKGRKDHPVVHVAYEDVQAYAGWVRKDLPSEAEWEFAARGGLDGAEYAWGDQFTPDNKYMANTWQGQFPTENLAVDGYPGTSPVGAFPPNAYGLYDMIGNVWEWTTDWYQMHAEAQMACCGSIHPNGDARERSCDPRTPGVRIPRKVIKGGSFLCAPNYCRRYRPAARMAQPIDTATCQVGFRLIIRRQDSSRADSH